MSAIINTNTSAGSAGNDVGILSQRFQNETSGDVVSGTPDQTGTSTGGTTTTLILDSNASGSNGYYVGWWVKMTAGPANNNMRRITNYVGSTKTITITPAFSSSPGSNNYELYLGRYVGLVYIESSDTFKLGYSPTSNGNLIKYADLTMRDLIAEDVDVATITATTSITTVNLEVTETATIAAWEVEDLNVGDAIVVGGELTCGAATVNSLSVINTSMLNSLSVSNEGTFGSITAAGSVTADSLIVEDVNTDTFLAVTAEVETITISGAATANSLTTQEVATVDLTATDINTATITASGLITAGSLSTGPLTAGATTLGATSAGACTFSSLTISGNTDLNTLDVSGAATLASADIAGAVTTGSLENAGNLTTDTLNAGVTVLDSLTAGATTLGAVVIGGGATINAATVSGTATITTLNVSGSSTLHTLSTTGLAIVDSIGVTNDASVSGALTSAQLMIKPGGSGTKYTFSGSNPAADRVYTIPDILSNGTLCVEESQDLVSDYVNNAGNSTYVTSYTHKISRRGNLVTITWPTDSATFTAITTQVRTDTALPARYRPSSASQQFPARVQVLGAGVIGYIEITTAGTIIWYRDATQIAWTGVNNARFFATAVTYSV